ncbi:GNAT family N-acetyltransferase [Cohnella zeiphila]|uniref:GNAT family N-acetyltransferase n=1 Tax=Cohnella zeiphila TaxID=2761120 RepID=A0A7X0SIN8_9BACL|nr:GNAT family N-acetyltransferase [Cohnella zeiphila]MBB6730700.1 GNAT family N-acetyltransferase [Cohnella zeiphila]
MYHEFTGVSPAYRGRRIATALKLLAIRMAKRHGADYLRTDNDSANEPILRLNRSLGYKPLRGTYRMSGNLREIERCLRSAEKN